jgi:RNA-directed DNA polymerase
MSGGLPLGLLAPDIGQRDLELEVAHCVRGVSSPLLANLFMHYAFDKWMDREHPGSPFERYADDVVIHCDTEDKALHLWAALAERLGSLGLELHPEKTKVVYCKECVTNAEGGAM